MRRKNTHFRWFCFAFFLLLTGWTVHITATDITWTPNEDAEAPLPLSNNQRQQLLELEQVIRTSTDPQGTLLKVAESNQMDPNELVDLLNRNRRDLEAAGLLQPMPGGSRSGRNVWKAISSLALLTSQIIAKHPKSSALIFTTLLLTVYVANSAPRNGVVLSSRQSLISKGPTTWWEPPLPYLQQLMHRWKDLPTNVPNDLWKDFCGPLEDGVVWHKKTKASIQQGLTAQVTLNMTDMVPEMANQDVLEEITDLALEQAASILATKTLTEWSKEPIKLIVADAQRKQQQNAILVCKGLGDWKRYGLVPLNVIYEEEKEGVYDLVFSTTRHSFWNGLIHIQLQPDDTQIKVSVRILVPKKGQKIPRHIATRIAQGISQSIATSIRTRTKQSIARRSQSSRFQGSAHQRATDRRHTRFQKEKELEDMASDRRRRWQRQNPNAGHYRPSGDRLQSPNNAIYK